MQGYGTLAIYHIYPHIYSCFTQFHEVNVKMLYYLGWANKFINQICKDKPQKCMLHFVGRLNKKSQGPTSQPEKCMLHFWVLYNSQKIALLLAIVSLCIIKSIYFFILYPLTPWVSHNISQPKFPWPRVCSNQKIGGNRVGLCRAIGG